MSSLDDPGTAAWTVESLLSVRQDDQALELAHQAVARFPADADVARVLAKVQLATGDADAAEASSARAVALDPLSARALRTRRLVLAAAHRDDEAIAACEAAIALDPAEPFDRVAIVDLLLRGLDDVSGPDQGVLLDRCEEHLRAGLATDPDEARLSFQMAKVAHFRGDDAASEQWTRQGLALDPTNRVGTQQLGLLARSAGDLDTSDQLFRAAARDHPYDVTWSEDALAENERLRAGADPPRRRWWQRGRTR